MICPNCNLDATFQEHSWGDEMWLVCNLCGKPTDDKELAQAQPPETNDDQFTVFLSFLPDILSGILAEFKRQWRES